MKTFNEGDRVRLAEEYKPGSNRITWKSGVIVRVFANHSLGEAWINTEEGYKIIEYMDYLELVESDENL
jgi:hypothetical protein